MTVYGMKLASGYCDSYRDWIAKVFINKDKCLAEIDKYNEMIELNVKAAKERLEMTQEACDGCNDFNCIEQMNDGDGCNDCKTQDDISDLMCELWHLEELHKAELCELELVE